MTLSLDDGAKSILFGAQSILWAWGKRPYRVDRDFDYGLQKGYSWNMIAGVTAPTFNSKQYGSVGIFTSTSGVSAA